MIGVTGISSFLLAENFKGGGIFDFIRARQTNKVRLKEE